MDTAADKWRALGALVQRRTICALAAKCITENRLKVPPKLENVRFIPAPNTRSFVQELTTRTGYAPALGTRPQKLATHHEAPRSCPVYAGRCGVRVRGAVDSRQRENFPVRAAGATPDSVVSR